MLSHLHWVASWACVRMHGPLSVSLRRILRSITDRYHVGARVLVAPALAGSLVVSVLVTIGRGDRTRDKSVVRHNEVILFLERDDVALSVGPAYFTGRARKYWRGFTEAGLACNYTTPTYPGRVRSWLGISAHHH